MWGNIHMQTQNTLKGQQQLNITGILGQIIMDDNYDIRQKMILGLAKMAKMTPIELLSPENVQEVTNRYYDSDIGENRTATTFVGNSLSVIAKVLADVGNIGNAIYQFIPTGVDSDVFGVVVSATDKLPKRFLRNIRRTARRMASTHFGFVGQFETINGLIGLKTTTGQTLFATIGSDQSNAPNVRTYLRTFVNATFHNGAFLGSESNTLILLGIDSGRRLYAFDTNHFAEIPLDNSKIDLGAALRNSVLGDWGIALFAVNKNQWYWFIADDVKTFMRRKSIEVPLTMQELEKGALIEMDLATQNQNGVWTTFMTLEIEGVRYGQVFAITKDNTVVRFNALTPPTELPESFQDVIRHTDDTVTTVGHVNNEPAMVTKTPIDQLDAPIQALFEKMRTAEPVTA